MRESKINSSPSFDDGDELFFFEVGLGDALLGDGDGPVVFLAGLGDELLGDGDDATDTAQHVAASVVAHVAPAQSVKAAALIKAPV